MKSLLSLLLITVFAAAAIADINEPPMATQSPVRKLGRGLSNIAFGSTELPYNIADSNETQGNSAALGYGVVRGTWRTLYRLGAGVYEVFTFPFPTNCGTYNQPYPSNVVWAHAGYTEFPPELGFETRYRYSRNYGPNN